MRENISLTKLKAEESENYELRNKIMTPSQTRLTVITKKLVLDSTVLGGPGPIFIVQHAVSSPRLADVPVVEPAAAGDVLVPLLRPSPGAIEESDPHHGGPCQLLDLGDVGGVLDGGEVREGFPAVTLSAGPVHHLVD